MHNEATAQADEIAAPAPRWSPPGFELIPLDCEITAYAPEGDLPLF